MTHEIQKNRCNKDPILVRKRARELWCLKQKRVLDHQMLDVNAHKVT